MTQLPTLAATQVASRARLASVDVARGVAVLGMFGYHLTWDLANFGYIDPQAPFSPWFRLYSHCVACTFVFLAGVSLVLARRSPFRWSRWARHLATIVVAAGLVTLTSALVFPEGLIGFGILHLIAVSIVLATPFLFLPPAAGLLVSLAIAALPMFVHDSAFDGPALIWTGLGTIEPQSNDFRPFFPWAAPAFAGVAAMTIAVRRGLIDALSHWAPSGPLARLLSFGGRHSLAIYLIHQPIFFGALAALAALSPPGRVAADVAFTEPCESRCAAVGASRQSCARTCGCIAKNVRILGLWDRAVANTMDDAERMILSRVTQQCLRQGT